MNLALIQARPASKAVWLFKPEQASEQMRIRILILLALSTLIFLSACSAESPPSAPIPESAEVPAPQESEAPVEEDLPSPSDNGVKNNIPSSPPQNMAAFEGEVFVTTTDVVADLWRMSGWNISDTPLNTDQNPTPLDCTLYPHAGVEGQWVGGCRGYVLIPRNGAEHIAAVVISPDGSTQTIQVAPDPNNP